MVLTGNSSLRAVPASTSDLRYRSSFFVPEAVFKIQKAPLHMVHRGAGKRGTTLIRLQKQPSVEAFDGANRRGLLDFARGARGGVTVAHMHRLSPAAGSLRQCAARCVPSSLLGITYRFIVAKRDGIVKRVLRFGAARSCRNRYAMRADVPEPAKRRGNKGRWMKP